MMHGPLNVKFRSLMSIFTKKPVIKPYPEPVYMPRSLPLTLADKILYPF